MNMNTLNKLLTLLIMLSGLTGILCSCSSPATPATPSPAPTNTLVTPTPQPSSNGPDVVEVVYFHRTQRCYSCRYAGDTTEYVVETYFAQELANGTLVFKTVDVQDQANAAIVKQYEAYGSSLFINKIIDGTDHIETITDIWFLIGNDAKFIDLVKSEIESSLGNS